MNYKVLPLFYAANENFKNTIRFSVEFTETIDFDSFSYAVMKVQERYPYFSVKVQQQNEEYILKKKFPPFCNI